MHAGTFTMGLRVKGPHEREKLAKRTFRRSRNSEVSKAQQEQEGAIMAKNASTVRGQKPKAKSPQDMTEVLRETTKLWRKHHLSYDQSRYVVEQVRRTLQLSAPGSAGAPWRGSINTRWGG